MTQVTPPITTSDPAEAVRQWFTLLSGYCASVDYDAAESIVAEDVASFGTAMDIVSGRTALRDRSVGEYLGEHHGLQDGPRQRVCARKRQSGLGSGHMDVHRL